MPLFITLADRKATYYLTDRKATFGGAIRPWEAWLRNTPSLSIQAGAQGGCVKPNLGDLQVDRRMFAATSWPPERSWSVQVEYGADDNDTETLVIGTLLVSAWDADTLTFKSWQKDYETLLLAEVVDYNGDTIQRPVLFGDVGHIIPPRAPDYGGDQTFFIPSNLAEAGLAVYDDGVVYAGTDWTNNGNGTFSVHVVPVGQVSITGSNGYSTLQQVFNLAKTWLGWDNVIFNAGTVNVRCLITQQQAVMDFLNKFAWASGHIFEVRSNVCYVTALSAANTTYAITDFRPPSYSYGQPIAQVSSSYSLISAGLKKNDTGSSVYSLLTTQTSFSVPGSFDFGGQLTAPCFTWEKNAAANYLSAVVSASEQPRCSLPINLAELGSLPHPGDVLQCVDDRISPATTISLKVRAIEYHFDTGNEPPYAVFSGEAQLS